MKYSLFHREDNELNTYEIEQEITKLGVKYNINNYGLDYYDALPKLQCHSDENEATDGAYVLLFYKGSQYLNGELGDVNYWISDDLVDMIGLNEGICHLLTNSEYNVKGDKIAIKTNVLPSFTRDLVNFGVQQGNIVNSWNFGHPMATFVPNTYTTNGDSIYDKSWKSYINDLYDVDSRQMDCYVLLGDAPKVSMLRKYYWFENGIWRLNEIKDANIASNEPVLCSFIKVKDTNAYTLSAITDTGIENIVLNQDRIGQAGGTITGTIYLQSGGRWFSNDSSGNITGRDASGNTYYLSGALTPFTGSGESTQISITVPANDGANQIVWEVRVEDDFDNALVATFVQEMRSIASLQFVSGTSSTNLTKNSGVANLYYQYYFRPIGAPSPTMTYEGDWIRPTNYTGPNPKQIKVYYDANDTTSARTATITINAIGSNGETLTDVATLTQAASMEAGSLNFNESTRNVSSGAGTTYIGVTWQNMDANSLYATAYTPYGVYNWATNAQYVPAMSAVAVSYEVNETRVERELTVEVNGDDLNGNYKRATMTLHQGVGTNTIDVSTNEIKALYNQVGYGNFGYFGVSGGTTPYTITVQDN